MQEDLREIKRAIPRELWLRARSQAVLEGKTMARWIIEAIREKLDSSEKIKGGQK